jgi:hypothetical protein
LEFGLEFRPHAVRLEDPGHPPEVVTPNNFPNDFPEEGIMRLWDSALLKVLAVISLIALVSVAQAVIQGL